MSGCRYVRSWPLALWVAAGALLPFTAASAEAPGSVDPMLPHYVSEPVTIPASAPFVTSSGALRIVGYNDMRDMLEALTGRFTATHPGFAFELDLNGTRSAPPALAAGTSALAPMGAEFTSQQLADYRAASTGDGPLVFRVAHAALDPRALSGPLGVFVAAANPLQSITLPQLAAIYAGTTTRWRDLGVTGALADRSIHTWGLDPDTALALFFGAHVPGATPYAGTVAHVHQSRDVIAQVGADPLAIGFAAAMCATPSVRALALAPGAGQAALLPTEDNILSGRYPLDRYLLIYVRSPASVFAREFLRLVLSREGQQIIADTPQHYLPLTAAQAVRERAQLGEQR